MPERWTEQEFHDLFMNYTNNQTMNQKEALELSVKKWQMIVDNDGIYSLEIQRKFAKFQNSCPLCHLYFGYGACEGCPINLDKTDCACQTKGHPFKTWLDDRNKATAQSVLNLIKSKL
jgi:hypothetical protein